jgi:hypothetical protein
MRPFGSRPTLGNEPLANVPGADPAARHVIFDLIFRDPALNSSPADEPLKSGPSNPATRPNIWTGATLLIDRCGCNPYKPDRSGPCLDDPRRAEGYLMDELSCLVGFRQSTDRRRCGEVRRPELADREEPPCITRKDVCLRFMTRSSGHGAGIDILRERGANQSNQEEKCAKGESGRCSYRACVHPSFPRQSAG